ncbi:hypothetical protein [Noviherbaspirillum aerium]|uniref:hypothetical protein n=1 Tax=Noviherbaspirillum aerium TaxID=2588497 RepID=UPI00178C7CE3|nr:hypothetical protein [Noviherbaspirillum aerium]
MAPENASFRAAGLAPLDLIESQDQVIPFFKRVEAGEVKEGIWLGLRIGHGKGLLVG